MKKKLIISAAVGAASYAGLCALIHYEIFNRKAKIPSKIYQAMQPKADPDKPKTVDPRAQWLSEQDFIEYRIENDDSQSLYAQFLPAQNKSHIYVLCSHGYRSRGRSEFRLMTKFYHDLGFNVLLVDHRASGDSEGNYITFGKKESAGLLLWIDKIRNEFDADAQIILHGVSMGAASVLMLSDKREILPNVKFIVSDCAFTSVTDEFRHNLKKAHIPSSMLIGSVDIVNRIISGFSYYEDSPSKCVIDACVPILFIHGGSDDFVPTFMSQENYEICSGEKDILIIDGAAHAESYPTDSAAYEEKVKEFISKYLDKESD